VSSGDGVTINTPGINVRLSGIKINGIGGANGVTLANGDGLTIENCIISNFSNNGVNVTAAARVRITDTLVSGNGLDGIYISAGATADVVNSRAFGNIRTGIFSDNATAAVTTNVAVTNSISSQNTYGFLARANGTNASARMSVDGSTASNNLSIGFYSLFNSGTLASLAVSNSKATQNNVGFQQAGGGSAVFTSLGNNMVLLNGTNTLGTITAASGI
jgi:hypothetical protein